MARYRIAIIYGLFFVGGAPALVYQTIWQRVFTLYFGVDIYSTSVTVASVMLGLGIGSLFGGRIADRMGRPILIYVATELLIGCFGVLSLPIFSAIGSRLAGYPIALLIPLDFALLLVPAGLMGMTLPLMCRIVINDDDRIGQHLSWLYGLNTLGAAFGALLSSYLLCGLFGLDGTTYIAASINFLLAAGAFAIARSENASPLLAMQVAEAKQESSKNADRRHDGYTIVVLLSFVSGFVALGYEIVWYRVLTLLLHATVYVFGTILSVYLLGIAAGSLLARKQIDQPRPLFRFALCQLGIAFYTLVVFGVLEHLSWLPGVRHLISASLFTAFHPSPELVMGKITMATLYSLLDIFFWVFVILGPPTVLMGYGFPNLLRAGSASVETLGKSVARLYFANILGSTLGVLAVGFVALEYCGSEITLALLAFLGALSALGSFGKLQLSSLRGTGTPSMAKWSMITGAVIVAGALLLPWPMKLIRAIHLADFPDVEFLGAEDCSGVAALRIQNSRIAFPEEDQVLGTRRVYVDGTTHGIFKADEDVVGEWCAEWAFAAHPKPRRVLAIGWGDGKVSVTALRTSSVEELFVVELSSSLCKVLAQTPQGRFVLQSPETTLIHDDGRRWLNAHPDEKFDMILTWPLPPATSHSGNLYSIEYFELVGKHLAPGGIVFTRSADLFSTPRTLATVYPFVVRAERGYYLASHTPISFDLTRIPMSTESFLHAIEADRQLILDSTKSAPVNRDLQPVTEYYLTYPYVWTLQTWGRPADHAYQFEDRARSQTLIRHADESFLAQ